MAETGNKVQFGAIFVRAIVLFNEMLDRNQFHSYFGAKIDKIGQSA